MAVDKNKEVWEGWTVGSIYDDVKWQADLIQRGEAIHKPFKSQKEIADWIKDTHPNFKKSAGDVSKLLAKDYNLPAKAVTKERD